MDMLIEGSTFISNLIVATLVVGGWNYATRKDKLLGFIRSYSMPEKVKTWLYGCLVCSSSWIGSIYYFVTMDWQPILFPFWVFSLAGLCVLYEALINKLYRP